MDAVSFAGLAAVAFFAATVQAATGFGFAIIAVPFFLLIMGSLSAIQVTAVISFVITLVLIPRLLKDAPIRLLLHLVIGSMIGFPIGLVAFKSAELSSVKIIVGVLITVFAVALLAREMRIRSSNAHNPAASREAFVTRPIAEVAIGIISGIMGMALAMPGPVVVLYLLARHAGKQISRAGTLLLFGFSYGTISLLHTLWGGMTGNSWLLAVKLSPFVAIGAVLGHFATRYLSEHHFRTVVLVILIASGSYGIWTAL